MTEPYNNRVAVVHGRNSDAKDAIWGFLQDLGLAPLEWGQAIRDLGSPTPHTFEVVEQLFRKIQAVVVLLTPDETAYLRSSLSFEGDDRDDLGPAGQPRQNVLIEAGMAFGLHRKRTVIVEIGSVRQASDLKGMNVVRVGRRRLTDTLWSLAGRLQTAGCTINTTGSRFLEPARFERALATCDVQEREYPDLLFRETDRALTFAQSIASTGLVDIENRGDRANVLPPDAFYRRARSEIVITGLTLRRTFDEGMALLRETLERGVNVHLVALNPESLDVEHVTEREKDRAIKADIEHVVSLAAEVKRSYGERFDLRLMAKKPPFTAVMIDGDIRAQGSAFVHEDAEIRVQPASMFDTQHEGLVLVFKNQQRAAFEPRGVFEYFADDLRMQWQRAIDLA